MAGIGATGFILIILVALILFGPQKLPELGRAVGKTLGEFKKGTKEIMDPDEVEENSGVAGKETTVTSAATEKQTSE